MGTISRIEVGRLAFIKLRREGKKDEALTLALAVMDGIGINLNIGDFDWEISLAIEYCGGVAPKTISSRGTAHFSFIGDDIEVSDELTERNRIEFYD